MFIQVVQGKVSDREGMRGAIERWQRELAPGAAGWLGATGGVADDGTFVGVVRFESEDAARRNSDRPEQGAWWDATSKLFTGEVTFRDCPDVDVHLRGGSDKAGFVQVIQGRVSDVDRMRQLNRAMDDDLFVDFRPDVIGSTAALHGDGGFTETVYFTSETEARIGELREPPPQLREVFEEEMALISDLTYLDLRDPWLTSPR